MTASSQAYLDVERLLLADCCPPPVSSRIRPDAAGSDWQLHGIRSYKLGD
jgi:hypothetical protein